MKRKIFSLFLIIIMVMVFSPIVHAETKPEGAEWLVDEGENHVWYQLIENTPTTNPVSYTLIIGGSGDMPDWDFSPDADNPLSFLNTPWRDKDTHYFKNITKIEIKEGITKIGNNSFSLAKNIEVSDTSTIEEVVLPESLESIGNSAFKLNTTLENIKFPSKLYDIGSAAFQDCGLKEVVLPESLETLIKGGAFLNNKSLEKVTLPSKLTRIGAQTFNGCTSLNTIVSYNTSAPILDANALKNTSISNITIPSGSLGSYETSWNIDTTSVTVKYIYTFTYKFINGDNQELTSGDIKSYVLKIDGDYSLFESLKIGNLDLIKDEDYEVTEGSTVITFTDKGIAKLNALSKGEYEIVVKYSNEEEVKGKLIMNQLDIPEPGTDPEVENPKTRDNVGLYLVICSLSLISLTGCGLYLNRKRFN